MHNLTRLYQSLLEKHGPQGWWPVAGEYHPGDYSYPRNDSQRFEICIGAILTQNTTWISVEKALLGLRRAGLLSPKVMLSADQELLAEVIRPAGYFNQKAKKLRIFAEFYQSLKGKAPSREELLSLWGIGPETADSILLYAYSQPEFVVDAYTRRILLRLGMIDEKALYNDIKEMFESGLKKDYRLFNEFHALFVEHGKNSGKRK